MKPRVTIITPCFNAGRWIGQTLDSIKSQHYDAWECIIVDDGSTDNSRDIILQSIKGDSRFTYIGHDRNKGLSAARNTAIEHARTVYLFNLDADDLIGPDFLAAAVAYMDPHTSCPCVYGLRQTIGPDGHLIRQDLQPAKFGGLLALLHQNQHNVSCLYRTKDARAIGGYYTGLRAYEDWDFWIRYYYANAKQGPHCIPVVSFQYRDTPGSLLKWADQRRKALIEKMKYHCRDIYRAARREATTDKPVYVVIPYIASQAQGKELEYAVAGWRRHFKEPHKIVIVGDYHPITDTGDDIEWIEQPRQKAEDYPDQYLPHIDHVHKFLRFLEVHPDAEGWIYSCDDIYAVNDFDLSTVRILKVNGPMQELSFGAWERDETKTSRLLKSLHFPTRSWVCHLPVWYDKDKYLELVNHYDLRHQSYVFEDLYFNMFYPARVAEVLDIDHDIYRCGVWRSNPRTEYIDRAITKKIWLTNGVTGWVPYLVKKLEEYYGQ